MIKKIALFLLTICCGGRAFPQTVNAINHKKKIPAYELKLMHVVDNLKADSVKIYSFSCGKILHPPKGILLSENKLTDLLIDSTQHWAYPADTGKMVKPLDIKGILKTIKYEYLDTIQQPKPVWVKGKLIQEVLLDEPTGCYEPRMGIMFFKGGIVQAHVDVCLTCGKLVFEQFNNGHVSFRYFCVVLGPKMRPYFNSLCIRYQLLCCKNE